MYRVLWIDDQYDQMKGFHGQAKLRRIELQPFRSAEKAIRELETNPLRYDAILLDALFFLEEDDSAGSESIDGLIKTKERIDQLVDKPGLCIRLDILCVSI